ncbi:unnamed protein product [Dovyalis caffra]|uniref:Pentatricopeptide repeat-containing protein n=1 Tax=Dovyalis caffra TaxID=77055 RepID=A0AAV1SE40_9ROSI|nr:unnamed protein product [Dovyalis caffra]
MQRLSRFSSRTIFFSFLKKPNNYNCSLHSNIFLLIHKQHLHQNPTNISNKTTNGFGLISLQTQQPLQEQDNTVDEFASDVEKVYRLLRKFHSRVPKLELALQESGVVMRNGLTERVLNRCGDAGNLAYKFFVWASKQPGYRHCYENYKAMIKVLSKMKQFGAVWALIDEMRRDNSVLITSEVFVVVMRRFASSRMVDKAIEVLDEMPKYGCEPDEYVFGCLLDALCKNGSVKEAASLFEDMRVRFSPSLKHFTSLLYGWCKEGKLLEAKHVLVQMRVAGFEPDIVVYNNLLSGYAMAGQMGDAFDLLKEMRRKGCNPNATSYTILIQALCGQEKMDEAMRVFVEMERSGCDADVVTYTTLISGFCKWGMIDRGYQILHSMIQKGHMPNQLTYLHLMLAHEKKEELEECKELMGEMQKIGCIPDLSIYNVVIRLACKLGEVNDGVDAWNEMEASGFSPGLDTFVIMINGFLGHRCLVEACQYFKEMVGRGLLSSRQYGILKDLLNALLRDEKLELAKDLWSCIVTKGCELNVDSWTIWIHALFSNGHVKEACSYCLDMTDADLMPKPETFAKLMRGLRKLYNRQFAAEITEKVRKMAADRQRAYLPWCGMELLHSSKYATYPFSAFGFFCAEERSNQTKTGEEYEVYIRLSDVQDVASEFTRFMDRFDTFQSLVLLRKRSISPFSSQVSISLHHLHCILLLISAYAVNNFLPLQKSRFLTQMYFPFPGCMAFLLIVELQKGDRLSILLSSKPFRVHDRRLSIRVLYIYDKVNLFRILLIPAFLLHFSELPLMVLSENFLDRGKSNYPYFLTAVRINGSQKSLLCTGWSLALLLRDISGAIIPIPLLSWESLGSEYHQFAALLRDLPCSLLAD